MIRTSGTPAPAGAATAAPFAATQKYQFTHPIAASPAAMTSQPVPDMTILLRGSIPRGGKVVYPPPQLQGAAPGAEDRVSGAKRRERVVGTPLEASKALAGAARPDQTPNRRNAEAAGSCSE